MENPRITPSLREELKTLTNEARAKAARQKESARSQAYNAAINVCRARAAKGYSSVLFMGLKSDEAAYIIDHATADGLSAVYVNVPVMFGLEIRCVRNSRKIKIFDGGQWRFDQAACEKRAPDLKIRCPCIFEAAL